ncbi:hypothetical protein E2C01_033234 [Portunus trituberculatus]|uniref:Uncharacterized protein n=1 Tax=Portunus trituberculatus TaxID=210409 RepID=A0A5B7F379_PORTR|nr:hypothetical protein [Portunus trituberculatus]
MYLACSASATMPPKSLTSVGQKCSSPSVHDIDSGLTSFSSPPNFLHPMCTSSGSAVVFGLSAKAAQCSVNVPANSRLLKTVKWNEITCEVVERAIRGSNRPPMLRLPTPAHVVL